MTDQQRTGVGKIFAGILGVATILGAAATVWQAWFKAIPVDDVVPVDDGVEAPPAALDPRVAVEKLTGRWMAAWQAGDADRFIEPISEPFYFDQRILLTKADVRAAFIELVKEKGESWKQLEITRIQVSTARELEQEGRNLSSDRIFGNMNLTLDDWAARVYVRSPNRSNPETLLLFARDAAGKFEIVGMWD